MTNAAPDSVNRNARTTNRRHARDVSKCFIGSKRWLSTLLRLKRQWFEQYPELVAKREARALAWVAQGKARVIFTRLVQDSQDLGSGDDHMVSSVYFDLEYGGKTYSDLHVDVKQAVGGDTEAFPLEIGRVSGYTGPGNYTAFRDGVERSFRGLVGSSGRGIQIADGANVRMRNNTFSMRSVVEFPVTPLGGW